MLFNNAWAHLILLSSGSAATAAVLSCRHESYLIKGLFLLRTPSSHPAGTPGTPPSATAAIVLDAGQHSAPEAPVASAEVDAAGRPYLASEKWQRMGGMGDERPGLVERVLKGLYGDLPAADLLRVAWLAGTLFFIIGG